MKIKLIESIYKMSIVIWVARVGVFEKGKKMEIKTTQLYQNKERNSKILFFVTLFHYQCSNLFPSYAVT